MNEEKPKMKAKKELKVNKMNKNKIYEKWN